MSITRINYFQAAAGQTQALHSLLKSIEQYIAASQGCISCELLQSQEQSDQFVVLEKWASIADHAASIANFPKEQMQAAMPLFAKPPEGGFYHNSVL